MIERSIYELLIMAGAIAGVVVALFNATGRIKKLWQWATGWLFSHRREMLDRLERIEKTLADVTHEMKPNNGGSFRDVANRIETRLIIFEQRQRAVMTDSSIGVFETDAKGDFIWVNRKLCRIVGRTAEELMGHGWLNCINSVERDTVHTAWNEAVADGREFHLNFSVTTPEGVVIPIHVRSIRMIDKQRKLAGYIGFVSVVGPTPYKIDPAGLAEVV